MAIKKIDSTWCVYEGECRYEYIVDTDADFANLPESCPGSMAISPSGNVRIVNASGEWVAFGE